MGKKTQNHKTKYLHNSSADIQWTVALRCMYTNALYLINVFIIYVYSMKNFSSKIFDVVSIILAR